jgi:hypothetical protein
MASSSFPGGFAGQCPQITSRKHTQYKDAQELHTEHLGIDTVSISKGRAGVGKEEAKGA